MTDIGPDVGCYHNWVLTDTYIGFVITISGVKLCIGKPCQDTKLLEVLSIASHENNHSI